VRSTTSLAPAFPGLGLPRADLDRSLAVDHHLEARARRRGARGGEDQARLARASRSTRGRRVLRPRPRAPRALARPVGRDPFLGEWRPPRPRGPFLPAIVASIAEPLLAESLEECAPAGVAAAFVRLAGGVGAADLARASRDRARPVAARRLRAAALGLGVEPADLEPRSARRSSTRRRAAPLRAYQAVFPDRQSRCSPRRLGRDDRGAPRRAPGPRARRGPGRRRPPPRAVRKQASASSRPSSRSTSRSRPRSATRRD
jgi:hypothetical protein